MIARVAFYGSLLRSFGEQRRLCIESRLRYLGPCALSGRLYDLGRYPGLIPGEGRVRGELYEPLDAELIGFLDQFEGFDAEQSERSQYLRRRTDLIEPEGQAWVYVYNRPIEHRPWVRSGCWETYWREVKSAAAP